MLEKRILQQDFSRGMFRFPARHLIPEQGAYDLVNLLLDEDGSLYKAGGVEAKSSNAVATKGVTETLDLMFPAGRRTIARSADSFAFLAADDATLTEISTAGSEPARSVLYKGFLFVPGSSGALVYAGSRKTAAYSTGTVTVTPASAIVTGVGTTWLGNIDAGMILDVGTNYPGVVKSVDSDTQITLVEPWEGAGAAGAAYGLAHVTNLSGLQVPPPGFGGALVTPPDRHLALAAGVKLVGVNSQNPYRLMMSAANNPFLWTHTDHADFAGRILGVAALRDQLLVFTTEGLWSMSGMAFDLTDAAGNVQIRRELVAPDLVLAEDPEDPWGPGIASWGNSLIAACRDGVYSIDGVSQPVNIAESIDGYWRDQVERDYLRVGVPTIYGGHLLLPILSETAVGGGGSVGWAASQVLVCRLGTAAWTRLEVEETSFAARAAEQPLLLGGVGSSATNSNRLVVARYFEPAEAATEDWQLETRDYPTGPGSENTVRKVRVRYTLTDPGTNDPEIELQYAGADGDWETHPDTAPEGVERQKVWLLSKKATHVRFRLSGSGVSEEAKVRAIEAWVRPQGRD